MGSSQQLFLHDNVANGSVPTVCMQHKRILKIIEPMKVIYVTIITGVWLTQFTVNSQFDDNCHQPFGCFPNTPNFFHPFYRPVNTAPESPKKIDTKFYLYASWFDLESPRRLCGPDSSPLAQDHKYKPCVIHTEDFYNQTVLHEKLRIMASMRERHLTKILSNWDNVWTAIVVHGFLDSIKESTWMGRMKNKLLDIGLSRSYQEVVIVDWSGGNGIPYLQTTANSRLIGAQVTLLLNKLSVSMKFIFNILKKQSN